MLQSPIAPKNYGIDRGIIQLTQMFGENPDDYYPLSGHTGWDFRTKHYMFGLCPVLASHDGTIVTPKNAYDVQGGKYIKIVSDDIKIDGQLGKIETRYMHLSYQRFNAGTKVKAGQMIGLAGNTGTKTTGCHLHWDFAKYIKLKDGSYLNDDEGYKFGGCVDPLEYMLDGNVFQYGDSMYGRSFYCNGKKISRKEVDFLIPKQYR